MKVICRLLLFDPSDVAKGSMVLQSGFAGELGRIAVLFCRLLG
jgi:hypothetical protein